MAVENQMTVGQLIEALKKYDANEPVSICVKQYNKAYGKFTPLISTINRDRYETWVSEGGVGVYLTVHLPQPAIIARWPERK